MFDYTFWVTLDNGEIEEVNVKIADDPNSDNEEARRARAWQVIGLMYGGVSTKIEMLV